MNKRLMPVLLVCALIACALGLAACATATVEPIPAPSETATAAPTAEPTAEPTPEPTAEPTPEPTADLNADPMNVVQTIVNDPRVLGGEDTKAMTDNMGGMFGPIDVKQPNEGGGSFRFAAKDGAWMPYNTRLLDVGENRGNTQAFLIKFQPDPAENLQFNFIGLTEIAVTFQDDNRPKLLVTEDAKMYPFSDTQPNGITLEQGKWYYALMAFSTNGDFRCLVWEDGKAEERAYCEEKFSERGGDKYTGSNWEVVVGFGGNGALNVESYLIMDFDSLTGIQPAGGQSAEGNDNPTISGLGLDQGKYENAGDGVSFSIHSTAWGGAQKDAISCVFTLRDAPLSVSIQYPDKIYEIQYGDGKSYQFNAIAHEVVNAADGLDDDISKLTGLDAPGLGEEVVLFFDNYCMDKFGFRPDELIMMMYE